MMMSNGNGNPQQERTFTMMPDTYNPERLTRGT